MIIYDRSKKSLVIPNSLGNLITVDYSSYDDGFADGIEEGKAQQKALLENITISENGTYSRENGYDTVEVDIPSRYDEGVEDGKALQKAEDDAAITPTTAITTNGTYTADYGYKEVVVNVQELVLQDKSVAPTAMTTTVVADEGYDGLSSVEIDGSALYDEGMAAQKALLTANTITANGTYTRENGWNEVEVNVPQVETHIQSNKNVNAPTSQSYTITPDTGYDGVAKVTVNNIAPIEAGIDAGIAEQKAKLATTAITQNGIYTREDGWNSVQVAVEAAELENQKTYSFSQSSAVIATITPTAGYDGMKKVLVDATEVANYQHNVDKAYYMDGLRPLNVTQNGTYEADVDFELCSGGYERVTVNVPSVTTQICTQAEYNAMPSHSDSIIYLING